MAKPRRVQDIILIGVILKVGTVDALLIVLSKDGLVKRQGDGSEDGGPRTMCIGQDITGMFGRVVSHIDDELLTHLGVHQMPEIKGLPCKMTIGLQFADKEQDSFVCHYGSGSQGPPGPLVNIFLAAAGETEEWYNRTLAAGQGAPKGLPIQRLD